MASVVFPHLSKAITLTDGTRYGYIKVEAKPGNPTLLFLHGYPSSSYHWHYQVKQCQDSGYGMIAPDLLGYGDTDKPEDIESYDCTKMSAHVVEILDKEGLSKVVGVGHDWGSSFLSTVARLNPNRFSLLIFLAVGYRPGAAMDVNVANAMSKKAIGRQTFGYWHFHNTPEAAKIIGDADPMSLVSLFFPADPNIWIENMCEDDGMRKWIESGRKGEIAPWLSKDQIATHNAIMKSGGWTGPLNWYKQSMAGITAKSEAHLTDEERKIKTPTLFIGAENDKICIPAMQVGGMKPFVDDLTVKSLETSHWVMLEKPDETWALMHEFVKQRLG